MTEQPVQPQTVLAVPVPPARSLGLAGAVNARDLGGYRTADGRVLRHGVALRSDGLHRLQEADGALLGALGVRHVVDLRSLEEVRDAGPDLMPGLAVAVLPLDGGDPLVLPGVDPDSPTLHHLPVHARELDIAAVLRRTVAECDPVAARAELGDGGAARMMIGLYRWFVTDRVARERFATVLRLLAEPAAPPVLFHCTAGKDRTGWMAALLLTALGVDRETVLADYLETNVRVGALVDTLVASYGTRGLMAEPELLRPIFTADRSYLEAAFEEVEVGWADFHDFWRTGLGLDDAVLAGLRKNLLEDLA
ncbi:tyrosine-protein phosphatase [Kitasatospora sp. NPDC006697]|uniref:tyrosine-protein phosphatase n=1 Tax=Kitasatospora sp. NPDC006697 TaxID=3364020 RepID=UPI003697C824